MKRPQMIEICTVYTSEGGGANGARDGGRVPGANFFGLPAKLLSGPQLTELDPRLTVSRDSDWLILFRLLTQVYRDVLQLSRCRCHSESTLPVHRQHHLEFSSTFWLHGRNEDSLKRSVASCASRIPEGQIAISGRTYPTGDSSDFNTVIKEVIAWLTRPDNTKWLPIFDNIDQEYNRCNLDPDTYGNLDENAQEYETLSIGSRKFFIYGKLV